MAAPRAGRCGSFAANLEFIGHQVLHARVVHDHHDQVNTFDADLRAPTAAAYGEECRSAPAFGCAAGGDAASMLAAKDESGLHQARPHRYALSAPKHPVWNARVRGSHHFVPY